MHQRFSLALVVLALLVSSIGWPAAAPAGPVLESPMNPDPLSLATALAPGLLPLYQDLHARPELSGQEVQTARRMAETLKDLGFTVTEKVGGHGVAGVLANGPGPVLLIRADMDGLPVTEETGLPYASTATATDARGKTVSVMHACGHDMHMTVFTGTATLLARLREHWHGTLVMIAQPAEEIGQGSQAMLADGLYARFPRPSAALSFHVTPELEAGQVGYCPGYSFANVDRMDIKLRGVGGHGASPHRTVDPVVLAAQLVLALQTIVSREINPEEGAVVTVGSIHGGTVHNIIPEEVDLQLTMRSYSDANRDKIIQSIHRITLNLARAAGVPEDRMPELTLREGFTPALYNDPELTERMAALFRRTLGDAQVFRLAPEMIGEDFSRYGRSEPPVPILMFRLGTTRAEVLSAARQGGPPVPALHSSRYQADVELSIRTGVAAMTAAALEMLGK